VVDTVDQLAVADGTPHALTWALQRHTLTTRQPTPHAPLIAGETGDETLTLHRTVFADLRSDPGWMECGVGW